MEAATRSARHPAGSRLRGPKRVLAPVKLLAGVTGRLAPGLAARIAESMFLRPPQGKAPPRERAWIASGRRLRFRSGGRRLSGWVVGDGPRVLLVHGWGGRGSQLGAFVAPLVDRGFEVVGFDAPGHGDSDGRRSSVPEMAVAVGDVALELGPLHAVVAHSLGTTATTIALARGTSIGRCVFVAPPTELPYFTRGFCELLGFGAGTARKMQQRVERRFGVRFDELQASRLAGDIHKPLLIVHDRDDGEVPLAHAEELARAWRDARLVTTRGLGHRAILLDPQIVRYAADFVAEDPSIPF
jgi:pimeloyl-ACP methyl ester carboxylesterase